MTPQEHMGAALLRQFTAGIQCEEQRSCPGSPDCEWDHGRHEARLVGKAAGHAFRALEILYDREQKYESMFRESQEALANEAAVNWTLREHVKRLEDHIKNIGHERSER